MQRDYVKKIRIGKKVLLEGWVHELRILSKLRFLLLRDMTGIIQCVIKDEKLFSVFNDLSLESVVRVGGVAKSAKVKAEDVRGDVEVEVSSIELLNKAEELPIQINEKGVETELSKRLDYRSLDIRRKNIKAIFKIQSRIINAFREYFFNRGFIEIQPPGVIASASEGGTELFESRYFERKAFLAQSPQLYKQLAAISWEKVFSTSPVWRAEKHNTPRHLNECRQMDIEMSFADQMKVMKECDGGVKYIVKTVIKNCKDELKILGIKLKIPLAKYISYEETSKILNVEFGEDLTPENERELSRRFPDTLIFVHSWPMKIKPFYIMPKNENPDSELSEGFDAIYGGMEITSGGQRIHKPELLNKMLRKKGLNPDDFKFYVDSFRFGAPSHGGWSIGLERFTYALLGLDNIREACLFPRDRTRLTP